MSNAAIQSQLTSIHAKQDSAQFAHRAVRVLLPPGQYSLDVKLDFKYGRRRSRAIARRRRHHRRRAPPRPTGPRTTTRPPPGAVPRTCAVTPGSNIDNNIDIWAVLGRHVAAARPRQGHDVPRRRRLVERRLHRRPGHRRPARPSIAAAVRHGETTTRTGPWKLEQRCSWESGTIAVELAASALQQFCRPPPRASARSRFLYLDAAGHHMSVMVPSLKAAQRRPYAGRAARPLAFRCPSTASASRSPRPTPRATMNAALAAGKHPMLTPGIYHLEASLQVTTPGTVVGRGSGLATLIPGWRHPCPLRRGRSTP